MNSHTMRSDAGEGRSASCSSAALTAGEKKLVVNG
eukprot:CAMPEP_0113708346 /NCGR_PEP_ID=MMETSP0038_2-20120614/28917_1 /TAXON_ID=2898 /ORGANISM="Cryptomonas paramecium" /LENGTH=34 /DNA_ID=CAMNT_0000634015 /DNA_START=1 /DNA_END=105 /DNA_ORIENTATION=- /assembly_acc=CAM_ASM_000170